ncbi:MAG: conjugal transfer protein TraD [Alphaproteobacteria bacterium]|nr:conjugal transfer protein TraD [Alphaproteobacteria bacterium]
MTTIISKVSEIDLKIKALQEKKKHLEERNLHGLAKVIKKLNADSLPTNILIGSLLETVEAFQQKKDSIKNWQTKGKGFLEADKKNNNSSNRRRNSTHTFRKSQQNTESAAEAHEKDL